MLVLVLLLLLLLLHVAWGHLLSDGGCRIRRAPSVEAEVGQHGASGVSRTERALRELGCELPRRRRVSQADGRLSGRWASSRQSIGGGGNLKSTGRGD